MGCLGDEDRNRAVCVCGWRGVVHDLVPAPTQSELDATAGAFSAGYEKGKRLNDAIWAEFLKGL
jgi:hypothetical protein